jgi:lysylphosphatidylglycerol synthetase-like protein (DUF2156 family)
LRTPQGKWILQNCIGVGVLVLAPVIAIVLSLVKGRSTPAIVARLPKGSSVGQGSATAGRRDAEILPQEEGAMQTRGRFGGVIALALALIPAVLYIVSLNIVALSSVKDIVLLAFLICGIIAIVLSNHIVEKCNTSTTHASWLARWAGVLATMDVSVFIAIILVSLARTVQVNETEVPIHHELSGISYIILAVVFLIIVGGLGWCFYRAMAGVESREELQTPDEVGDESRQFGRGEDSG